MSSTLFDNTVSESAEGVAATGLSSARVRLTWQAPSCGADKVEGYKVHHGMSSGIYGTIVDAGNVTTTLVTGLTAGTRYYFRVASYDAQGQSGPLSAETSAVPLADPTAPPTPTPTITPTGPTLTSTTTPTGPTLTPTPTTPPAGRCRSAVTWPGQSCWRSWARCSSVSGAPGGGCRWPGHRRDRCRSEVVGVIDRDALLTCVAGDARLGGHVGDEHREHRRYGPFEALDLLSEELVDGLGRELALRLADDCHGLPVPRGLADDIHFDRVTFAVGHPVTAQPPADGEAMVGGEERGQGLECLVLEGVPDGAGESSDLLPQRAQATRELRDLFLGALLCLGQPIYRLGQPIYRLGQPIYPLHERFETLLSAGLRLGQPVYPLHERFEALLSAGLRLGQPVYPLHERFEALLSALLRLGQVPDDGLELAEVAGLDEGVVGLDDDIGEELGLAGRKRPGKPFAEPVSSVRCHGFTVWRTLGARQGAPARCRKVGLDSPPPSRD
ncbi:MAG: fibronectin type III domain-containing protein [Candidatus Schekmanbacteria bacterium]|nr:fibronectin type III domain-containing protein [Candidatus Schekmanbacteria bacterium]